MTVLFRISPEQRAQEMRRAEQTEGDARAWRRQLRLPALMVFAWQVIGLVCILASARTPSVRIGTLLASLGLVLGYGGSFFSVVMWYRAAAERGDV